MKKKVLVIRSVSFQQLDKNLEKLEQLFPVSDNTWEIHLLTHSHGVQAAKSYKAISHIIDYGSRKNFTLLHLPPALKKRGRIAAGEKEESEYEAIVVPVTNKSGAGFLNVLAMTLRIPAKAIYLCNLTSEVREISRGKIILWGFKSFFFSMGALALLLPLLLPVLAVLAVKVFKREHPKAPA